MRVSVGLGGAACLQVGLCLLVPSSYFPILRKYGRKQEETRIWSSIVCSGDWWVFLSTLQLCKSPGQGNM